MFSKLNYIKHPNSKVKLSNTSLVEKTSLLKGLQKGGRND